MGMMTFPTHIVAASALISNPQGQILLVNHPRRGWEPPGGQIENGETLIDGLRREIFEETGVHAEIGSLVGIYSNIKPPSKVIFAFLGSWQTGDLQPSAESPELGWVDRDQVLTKITHAAIFERTSDMLNFGGQVIYRVYTTDPYQLLETHKF